MSFRIRTDAGDSMPAPKCNKKYYFTTNHILHKIRENDRYLHENIRPRPRVETNHLLLHCFHRVSSERVEQNCSHRRQTQIVEECDSSSGLVSRFRGAREENASCPFMYSVSFSSSRYRRLFYVEGCEKVAVTVLSEEADVLRRFFSVVVLPAAAFNSFAVPE